MTRGGTTAIRTAERLGPHAILAVAAASEVALEAMRLETGSTVWSVLAAVVALAALGLVWDVQDRLRLVPVCLIAVAFPLALIAVHALYGASGDQDPAAYWAYGNELLHGTYPESEYPVGAVLLFALEALLGGDSAELPNRLLMVPFELVCVLAVWSLRTRHSSWFAAVLAIFPVSTYFWQYRFDLVPAALILLGLLLAYRGRWGWSGVALAVGATVKWSPALSFVVLFVWLAAGGRWRSLGRTCAGFVGAFLLVNVPFLIWAPDRVVAAYRDQGGRAITNESLWYFPLAALGLTGDERRVWAPAGAPHWADVGVVLVQALLLVGLLVLTVRWRESIRHALVFAALAPVLFLLTNRVFSPQFMLVLVAALAFAGALTLTRRSEQLLLVALLTTAALANVFVYPLEAPLRVASWQPFSAALFATALAATAVILTRAVGSRAEAREDVDDLARAHETDTETVGGAIRRGREALESLDDEAAPATVPGWAARALRWVTIVLGVVFAVATVFVAVVLPYRYWDSLALGAWSRSIAEGGGLWDNASVFALSRPVFYVPQGLAWRYLADGDWIGRLFSASFAVALVVAVAVLARRLSADRTIAPLTQSLAVALLLGSAVFAGLVAAGMTDVPVAAGSAATAAAIWAAPTRWLVLLAAACACLTVLAKASGVLALLGLVAAVTLLHGRRALPSVAGVAAGAGVALLYDAWQASRIDMALADFLRAGNEQYWLDRGAAARWDAFARAEWLGDGIRLLVLYGLVHAVARAVGARPRTALAVAGVVAVAWSVAGPVIADGGSPYPFDGSPVGIVVWLVLVAAMAVGPLAATDDPIGRRTYGALLLWLAPMSLVWLWQRADEVRHLAPAWPALVLVAACALLSLSLALSRLRPAAVVVPSLAVATLALANLPSVDGLGRQGWRDLLEIGPSGWSSKAEMENYAYGPFSYELNAARENVGEGERILSSNGRLAYFFPGRVEVAYPQACAELQGFRFFSFLSAGESLTLAESEGQPTEPFGWLQCATPRLTMVAEHEGIYAAYVVGGEPTRPPVPEDCRLVVSPGTLVDGVFGDELSYVEAKALVERALGSGFAGTRIERTNCSTFRVVVTGVPDDEAVQTEFSREVGSVGLSVEFAPAARYPEVPADVEAVR